MLSRTFQRFLLKSLALVVCAMTTSVLRAEAPPEKRCVVLISVDGLANFYLDDPRAEMPTIRRLAREGAQAAGMIASFPTVTWPNHTTLVTGVDPGKHGVIGNNYFDRQQSKSVPFIPDPLFDKDEIVKVPTIYDVASKAGLTTAAVIWPATRNAKTLHFTVPDMAGDDAWPRYGTPSWMQELREAGIPVDRHGAWVKDKADVQRDWLYTRLAAHALKHHSPNLLLVHLINVDHVQHQYGPRHDDAYWAVSQADDRVRDIVEAVEQSSHKDHTTIIVASDHGFFPIEKEIRPMVLLKQWAASREKPAEFRCVSQGGGCMVYFLGEAPTVNEQKEIKSAFASISGIQKVFSVDEFQGIGQSIPAKFEISPDLWLAAESGFSFSDSTAGEDIVVPRKSRAGTHGYLPDQTDMLATLVIHGPAIQQGVNLGKVSNRDVAPTIAALLDLELPSADGQPLKRAFRTPGQK